jgi:hypothetical protein
MSRKPNKNKDASLGKDLIALWSENEEHMGEMAAYHVSCEQLGIDPDDGWALMADAQGATS